MAVSEHSIVDSLSLLSALHVESQERAFLVQPTYSRSRALKQAKRKAFDVLFASLHGPLRSKIPFKPYNSVSENRHDIKVQLLSFVLGQRLQRHFDQADRLEALVDKILPRQDTSQDAESANRLSDICAVLKILLLLKNSVSPADPNSIGYEKRFFPLKKENEGNLPLLPSGPLHYGDSVYSRPYDPFYMHYPRHVFDGISVMHSMNSEMEKLHLPPGENLSGFFSITGVLGDQHENRTQSSLFGALTQSRNITLESKLQLPDLEDSGLFDISIPKLHSGRDFTDSHENTLCRKAAEDSFMDVSCAMFDSGMEDNIWEEALNFEPSKHFTWERRKIGPGVTDLPYMSEAGHQAMDHWYRLRQEKIHMICPSVPVISRDCISEESFVQDLINVSLGIPSSSFIFLKDLVTFELSDDIYLSGVTPEVLRSISEPFQLCGASYLRLAKFSRPQVEDSFYTKGLVFQAFLSCIRRILQHFCAIVLSIPEDITLFKLLTSSRKFMDQLNYLAALCKCESGTGLDNIDIFPTGVHLLSYIYQECLEGMGSDNYPMLLSILQGACGPYTVFVQDWIFYGTCRDRYGEFMIEVYDDYLQFKDKYYWTRGYTFTTNEVTESVPLFLSELAQEIFTCGKSVNLLKACNSQHFLCKLNDLEVPRIRVTFSEHDLVDMGTQCDFYVGKMQAIANNVVVARKNKEALEKRARQDLLQRAKQAAIEDIHRLQERVQEMRRLEDAKKRQELQFLKDQMDGDKERRTAEKQAQRQEDKDFIARVTRQEEALSEAEKELEKRAREELVEYYERLTEEAALREQRALWHVRRGKLQEKRQKFLTQDEMYWLEQYKNTEKPVVMDDDMPSWVKRYDGPAPVVVPDTSDSLPDWAQKAVGPDKGEPFVDADMKGNTTNQQDQVAVTSDLEPSQHQTLPPPVTTGIRMSQTQSSTAESSEQPQKASIHVFTDRHATTESKASERDFQPHIRSVENMSATKESDQSGTLQVKAHIKISDKMSATKQSEAERDNIPRLRGHASHHATLQSTEEKELNVPRLKRNVQQHSSSESQSAEWKIKKASVYGHASMESTAEVQIPRLKPRPQSLQDVSDREFKDFGIRPRIKINKDRHATQETESQEVRSWSGIRMGPISANQESQPVDTEELMRERFKARNVHGHASDSTVEKLLYGSKGQEEAQGDEEFEKVTITFLDTPLMEKFRYQDKFDFFGDQPKVDLMSGFTVYGSFGDHGNSLSPDVESFQYLPLPELLRQSITRPIAAQISLVNESIINYFMLELNIKEHFEALRKYLFMGDGDFAQNLSDILLEKLASNPAPHELLNPIFLNGTLSKAIKSSMHPDDKYAENLNFALKYFPKYLNTAAHDTLDCLQLKYKVDWPMNIIVTEESVAKYCKVFSFMMQLKRIVWVLKDVWHQLKRDALVYKSGGSCQFRQLQLFRQEMQHFVKVMQGYIANQVVLVTWQEFEEALQNTIHNLDDLHDRHSSYLDKAIFRCLLNTKAAPVMKIIQDIFRLITKFHSQLIHGAWNPAGPSGACHTNFSQMEASYKTFRQYSVFLFKVVNKLSVRGYQPHLQELLLRLNFNDYYKP